MSTTEQVAGAGAAPPTHQVVGVIDVGATAVRLEIAQIDAGGSTRTLESLQQAVRLGKDTFTRGRIQPDTTADCIKILRGFRRVMTEYGVTRAEQIRAVATSAVREAENRDAFLDRLFMATGINLEAIGEPEANRLTYIAVQGALRDEPALQHDDVLVVEVGGGSTELLLLQKGEVTYSNTYRVGALRMRESLETARAPAQRTRTILDQEITRAVDDIRRSVPATVAPVIVAISGDARFAASRLARRWTELPLARLPRAAFSQFVDQIATVSVDELVQRYGLAYQDAETIGPSLLVYAQLGRVFKTRQFVVPKVSMRDGLVRELGAREHWTPEFADQVQRAALTLARRCGADEAHAVHVADLSRQLFRELQPEHQLGQRFELYLRVAALLHEVGMFVSNRSYHKHSLYLISNSDLFGLTREDMLLIALVARYHRRAAPRPYHEGYMTLDRNARIAVAKLAAVLRVADALDSRDRQQVRKLAFERHDNQFIITIGDVEDLTLERLALKQKGSMFEDVYGLRIVLRELPAA